MDQLEFVQFELGPLQERPYQLVGFGENAVDLVCRVPEFPRHDTKIQMEKMLRLVGGQIATACSLCARWGLKTVYVGRVGSDDLGEFAQRDLNSEPMDVELESVPGASSHLSLIIVDQPTGARTILWDHDSQLRYKAGELKKERIVQGQLLHLDGNDIDASLTAARWAKEAGMMTMLDIDKLRPGSEELVPLIDFLIASMSFVLEFSASRDWREGLAVLDQACPGFVAVTRGEEGAAAIWKGAISEYPAYRVHAVDSTGAGDVFHGAFIYAMFQGWPVARAMRFSNAAGALSCTRLGARAGIPTLEEVLALEETALWMNSECSAEGL